MNDQDRKIYEAVLREGQRVNKRGLKAALRNPLKTPRLETTLRCPICTEALTQAGYCANCGEFRKNVVIGGAIRRI